MEQAKRFTELHLGLVAMLAGWVSTDVEEKEEVWTVYPNPVSETLVIEGAPMRQVDIYNMMGQKVLSQSCAGRCSVDVGFLAAGIYFVHGMDCNGKSRMVKIIKS